jgi:hypothetical protein
MTSKLGLVLIMGASVLTRPLIAGAATEANAPDITGTWERWPSQMYPPSTPVQFGTPRAPDPPLKEPYLTQWRAEQKKLRDASDAGAPIATGYEACIPDGMPTMMNGMFPMEILQSRGQVTIIQESYNQVRRIYLGETLPKPDEIDPTFFGRSVGRWEGDTLVVDTVGVKEYVRLRGVPHSENEHITEHLHMVAPDILHEDVTITDPKYLTGPWSYTVAFKKMVGYKILEYICENNRQYVDAHGVTQIDLDPNRTGIRAEPR